MNKELLFSVTADDCQWSFFAVGGKGGQKVNKTSTGARVLHPPSGAVGESRQGRSQLANRKAAWRKMVESTKFKLWINRRLAQGPTPEERVEKDMQTENLLVEIKKNGRWERAE